MIEVHWTAYVTAFTVPMLAAIGALIAYRQWRTAQNKLKLDLFDKRMLVYQAARDALGHITSHAELGHEQQIKYLSGIQTAKWLFGPEVNAYLSETLWGKMIDLELHRSMVYGVSTDHPERNQHVQLKAETLNWLIAQHSALDNMCSKYMVLGH